MPSLPRIVRALPRGPITRPAQALPVIVRIRWHHGTEQETLAIATAWTKDAVEVSWEVRTGAGMRSDWIPVADVRRSIAETAPAAEPPPHTRAVMPTDHW